MALISEPADISNKHALAKHFVVVAELSRGGGGTEKSFLLTGSSVYSFTKATCFNLFFNYNNNLFFLFLYFFSLAPLLDCKNLTKAFCG